MPDDPQDDPADLRAVVTQTIYNNLRVMGHEVTEGDTAYYVFNGPYGWVEVYFHHEDKLAEWALTTTREILRSVFEDAAAKLKAKGELPNDTEVTLKSDPAFDIAVASFLGTFIVEGMLGKLSSAFVELSYEAKQVFKGIVVSEVKRGKLPVPEPGELVEAWSKKMIASRKQFLRDFISHYTSPHRQFLKGQYDALSPVWTKAREIYSNNKELPTWKNMIAAAFPEYALPEDLVALLSGDPDDLSDLPEPIRERVLKATEGGEDYSRPSSIALEHAARLCRYEPFQHDPRTLRRHMKDHAADTEPQSESPQKPQKRGLLPTKKKSADKKNSLTGSTRKRISKKL